MAGYNIYYDSCCGSTCCSETTTYPSSLGCCQVSTSVAKSFSLQSDTIVVSTLAKAQDLIQGGIKTSLYLKSSTTSDMAARTSAEKTVLLTCCCCNPSTTNTTFSDLVDTD